MLTSNQHLNFNFDTLASILTSLFGDIKNYRSSLHAYRINLIISVPLLLNRRQSMYLDPRESLIAVLESDHRSKNTAKYCPTLTIPMTEFLFYYDAQLIREIATLEKAVLPNLAIQISSRQTAFNVYEANHITMLHLGH